MVLGFVLGEIILDDASPSCSTPDKLKNCFSAAGIEPATGLIALTVKQFSALPGAEPLEVASFKIV